MADRSYLSIGDVLSVLKDEFPDVTISKIRFLESQGLLDPERTPSGYRKFYPPDVERLRWILRQQKEHFLPLKVIKGRLDPEGTGPSAGDSSPAEPETRDPGGPGAGADEDAAAALTPPAGRAEGAEQRTGPATGRPAPRFPPRPPILAEAARSVGTRRNSSRRDDEGNDALTFEELLEASGLTEAAARDLERFGLIVGRPMARTVYYDRDCLAVANLAVELSRYGVEARHLRMYKTAAEREAGFFEQIVTPLLKQRNPRSREQAVQTVADLSELGEQLRRSMLRIALRDLTGG